MAQRDWVVYLRTHSWLWDRVWLLSWVHQLQGVPRTPRTVPGGSGEGGGRGGGASGSEQMHPEEGAALSWEGGSWMVCGDCGIPFSQSFRPLRSEVEVCDFGTGHLPWLSSPHLSLVLVVPLGHVERRARTPPPLGTASGSPPPT